MYTHSESRANRDTLRTHSAYPACLWGYLRVSRCSAPAQSSWCKVRYLKGLWEFKKKEEAEEEEEGEGARAGRAAWCTLGGGEGDLIPRLQIQWLNNVLWSITVERSTQKHSSDSGWRVCGKKPSLVRTKVTEQAVECVRVCVWVCVCLYAYMPVYMNLDLYAYKHCNLKWGF